MWRAVTLAACERHVMATASQSTTLDCVALAVGVSTYPGLPPLEQLPSCTRDAHEIARNLQRLDWHTLECTDPDGEGLAKQIEDFAKLCTTAKISFFFFSGHGVQYTDNQHYLLGSNYVGEARGAELSDRAWKKHLFETAYSVQQIQEDLLKSKCPLNILVLDCCRKVVKPSKSASADEWSRISALEGEVGFLLCYAVSSGGEAQAGLPGQLSPFTKHIVEVLFGASPRQSVFDALTEAQERTLRQLGPLRQPVLEHTCAKPFQDLCIDVALAPNRAGGSHGAAAAAGPPPVKFPDGLCQSLRDFWQEFLPAQASTHWQHFATILEANDKFRRTVQQCQAQVAAEARQRDASRAEDVFLHTVLKPQLLLGGDCMLTPVHLHSLQMRVANMAHQRSGRPTTQEFDSVNDVLLTLLASFDRGVLEAELNEKLRKMADDFKVQGLENEYGLEAMQYEYLRGSRTWLLDQVDQWLGQPTAGNSRLFLLLAGPGMGKSTFCAQLVQERAEAIAAHHFFKVTSSRCSSAKVMLLSLLLQLARRYQAARQQLERSLRELQDGELESLTLTESFERLMEPAVKAVDRASVGPQGLVVLLDGLDEAEVAPGGQPVVVTFLNACFMKLPAWLRLLVSTRPDLETSFTHWQPYTIQPQSPENMSDLTALIQHKLEEGAFLAPATPLEAATELVREKSQGVFIYTKYVFEELATHPSKLCWSLEELQDFLPVGIHAIYERILDRALALLQGDQQTQPLAPLLHGVLLPVLASMMEPLSVEELAWVTGMEAGQVEQVMHLLVSMFPLLPDATGVKRAHPYHKSVTDMLLGPEVQGANMDGSSSSSGRRGISSSSNGGSSSSSSSGGSSRSSSAVVVLPGAPEQRRSRWAVDAAAGHGLFVQAAMAALTGDHMRMQHWQQECTPLVPHARYVLRHAVSHMVAGRAWQPLHRLLCRELAALKAVLEAGQLLAVVQQVAVVLQDPAALAELGEVGLSDLRGVTELLRFDQQELQAAPQRLLQEAWNSPTCCCLHGAVRELYPAGNTAFWRECVQWCNPAETLPLKRSVLGGLRILGMITCCCVSADGSLLVACGVAKRLVVWDLHSMERIAVLRGHTASVCTCTISANGQVVVTGSEDNTLRVWDLKQLTCVVTLQGHTDQVTSCALSADGRVLVSGSQDHTLRVWDVPSRSCRRVLQGHLQGIVACTLSADGSCAVSGAANGALCVWDVGSGVCVAALTDHSDSITSCTLSADGCTLVSGAKDGTMQVWDLTVKSNITCVAFLQSTNRFLQCTLSADGNTAVAFTYHQMSVWNVPNNRCVAVMQTSNCWTCSISANAQVLVLGEQSELHVFDLSSLLRHTPPMGLTLLDATRRRGGGTARRPVMCKWDLSDANCTALLKASTRNAHNLASSPDLALTTNGHTLAMASSRDNSVQVWSTSSLRCVATLPGHVSGVAQCGWSADGCALVTVDRAGTARRWTLSDTVSCTVLSRIHGGVYRYTSGAYTHTFVVKVPLTHDIGVWDVRNGQCVATLRGHTAEVTCCTVSTDGRTLVSGSDDGTLRVWDLASSSCVATLTGHTSRVRACALSADALTLVSSSTDTTLRVWDMGSMLCVSVLRGHSDGVGLCSLDADGCMLVSGSDDGVLRVWDMLTKLCVAVLEVCGFAVHDCSISADGCTMVSSWAEGEVFVFELDGVLRHMQALTDQRTNTAVSAPLQFRLGRDSMVRRMAPQVGVCRFKVVV